MALKPDREELAHDISWYMNEVAERGGVVTQLTAGSGGAWKTVMGDTHNLVTYAAAPTSGSRPVGLLLNDMVNVDVGLGMTQRFGQRDEMPVGGKCTLLRRGWVTTNKIVGTPVGGESAFVGPSGLIGPAGAPGITTVPVGSFLGSKDEDGYARVSVLL
jgi:hypothetical protein